MTNFERAQGLYDRSSDDRNSLTAKLDLAGIEYQVERRHRPLFDESGADLSSTETTILIPDERQGGADVLARFST